MDLSKKEMLSLRIPKELNQKLTERVTPMGISKCAFILNLIHKELRNNIPVSSATNFTSNVPEKSAV